MEVENRSAVEQYAEIKLREERAKASIQKWTTIIVLGLVIFTLISNFFSSMYLNSTTVKKILETTFESNSDKYISSDISGHMLIGVQAESRESALLNLRESYLEMSKKQNSDQVKELALVIYDTNNRVMFNSNITIDKIKNTDWSKITTYTEFIEMANVQ